MPVSAGPGVYIDDSTTEEISIPDNEKTATCDFALRVSGNSMEPIYHNGDLILIEDCDSVEVGELGIFVLDGDGYFKKFGGDRLISLNPEYADILIRSFSEAVCCGRVIGKLKRNNKSPSNQISAAFADKLTAKAVLFSFFNCTADIFVI